jgi:hypothetical protein
LQSVIDAGVPDVQSTAYTPQTITVRLPSFGAPTLSTTQKVAIGAALALLFFAGRR